MVVLEEFESQFLGFKEVEASKNQLVEVSLPCLSCWKCMLTIIQDLITRVRDLERALQDEKLHLEREQEATKSFQTRLHDALFVSQRREQQIV